MHVLLDTSSSGTPMSLTATAQKAFGFLTIGILRGFPCPLKSHRRSEVGLPQIDEDRYEWGRGNESDKNGY
jgi:hypothetical protein